MEKCNVVILGSDSQIGAFLLKSLDKDLFQVTGTSRRGQQNLQGKTIALDLCQTSDLRDLQKFDVAIFCAGLTDLKYCENFPKEARRVNVDSTIALIKELEKFGTRIVFLSSNSVFDGSKSFVDIYETPNPVSIYGKFKVEVENFLLTCVGSHSILRLSKVLTSESKFISRWNHEFEEGKMISVYKNHYLSPISLTKVKEAVEKLILGKSRGIYHLGAEYELSYYDFAVNHFRNNDKALKLLVGEFDLSVDNHFNSLKTFLPGISD